MIMKIKEAENRFFREWVKEENLCSNGRKKEISNATSPANLTAGNDSVDIFLSAHNITNEDNIVKSDTMQRYAKKCKGYFNGYLEL